MKKFKNDNGKVEERTIVIPKPLFNESLKREFLETYANNTARTYMYDLVRISDSEEYYNEDVYNFTYDQLDDAFKSMQCRSVGSVSRVLSTIGKYISWANSKGYVTTKTDIVSLFGGDKIDKYVWRNAFKNQYISRDEMYSICDQLVNAIDRVIIVLPFEGIKGERLFEMLNLCYDDINVATGEINVPGRLNHVTLCRRSIEILIEAKDQYVYLKRNNQARGKATECLVLQSPYVVKKTTNVSPNSINVDLQEDEMATFGYVESKYTRIFKPKISKSGVITDESVISKPFLNINNMYKSGLFSTINDLENSKGQLDGKDYVSVCEKYGINTERWSSIKSEYQKVYSSR